MKILIVTDAARPQINGVVTTLINLERQLRHVGCYFKIVTPSDFITLPLPSYPEIRVPLLPLGLYDIISEYNPDIVHIVTEGVLGFLTKIICNYMNIKYFTSYHTDWETTLKANRFILFNKLIKSYVKFIHKGSRYTLATNNDMANLLISRGYTNVRTWTRGVDNDIFNIMKRKDFFLKKPILLCVSRVSSEKGLDDFLSLKTTGTKILVGDGPLLSYYKQKYPDVIYMGALLGDKLAEQFASADVFVFPSKTDTFGVVMLEAISSGIPVAAYPVTGPNEVIIKGVNGFLDEDLTVAVSKCLVMDKSQIVKSSEKWSWQKVAEIYLEYINEELRKN